MSDMLKFHRVTKPTKFRRARLLFQSARHTYGVGIDKCKYLSNYVLYKLHILERYTHEDYYEVHRPVIGGVPISETHRKEIKTEHFVGVVVSELVDKVELKQDYFYREVKGNSKLITYKVLDIERHQYVMRSSVVNPGLIIDGKVFLYNEAPRIVRVFKHPKIKPIGFNENEPIPVPEPEEICYDMSKLMNIRYETVLGDSIELDVTYATVQGAIQEARQEIKKYLSSLSLRDIES